MPSDERGLSLYEIDNTLSDLIAMREEVTDPNEITAIDGEIREWVNQELLKFDRCFGYIKGEEQRASMAKEVAAEATKWQKIHENRAKRVRQVVKEVMESRGIPKLERAVGSFSIRNNGGPTPLEIPDPELLPDEYKRITISMPQTTWNRVQQLLEHEDHGLLLSLLMTVTKTADEKKVREALTAGELVSGATLKPRGTNLTIL